MINTTYETGYARALLKILSPRPDSTSFLTCLVAPGPVAVTLARKVRMVTANGTLGEYARHGR